MLKIKLSRTGKRNQPSYRIIIAEARSKRDGKCLDSLGFYNPLTKPMTVKIDQQKLKHWLSCGAQPTETVSKIIKMEAKI